MVKRTQTKWRWFAAAAIPSALIASGLMVGVANGAVPVAVNVAGETFKVSADELSGTDFKQYANVVTDAGGNAHPVAASVIGSAELTDLCQSVTVPDNPLGITASMVIRAGGNGTPASADNMTIGLERLRGDATFDNIFIGTDGQVLADSVDDDSSNALIAGSVGQRADSINITNLRQTAYSVHAGTFTLPGLDLSISLSGEECF